MAELSSRIGAQASFHLAGLPARFLTRERLAPVVSGLVILAVWEIYVKAALPDFVATPIGILLAIPSTMGTEEFWSDFAATL